LRQPCELMCDQYFPVKDSHRSAGAKTDVEPPAKAGLEDIEISPVPGYDWARQLVRKYMERPDITICATFRVPDAVLKPKTNQEESRTNEKE
jgi:hypothetical protein